MLSIYMHAFALVRSAPRPWARHDERGQASAEYALVLLGAAAIALLIGAWAVKTDLIGKLLDTVLDNITGKAGAPKTRA